MTFAATRPRRDGRADDSKTDRQCPTAAIRAARGPRSHESVAARSLTGWMPYVRATFVAALVIAQLALHLEGCSYASPRRGEAAKKRRLGAFSLPLGVEGRRSTGGSVST